MAVQTTPRPVSPDALQMHVDQAARLLGYSRTTVYRMIASGELPAIRRGRTTRVPRVALDEWIAERLTAGSDSTRGSQAV